MAVTEQINDKLNVKRSTSADISISPSQPVIATYTGTTTANQTLIANLGFSVDTVNNPFSLLLIIDGKTLTYGASNDFTYAAVDSSGFSSAITLNQSMPAGLNILALKLGLKPEREFQMDSRFTQLYEAQDNGFQAFTYMPKMSATTNTGAPAVGTFYSSITNRAQIIDLSQDLKSRMGIDRMHFQQITQLNNEFGPNGENVFAAVNDTLGQVRFVGGFSHVSLTYGPTILSSANTTDYMEVTFYGTGLSLLMNLNSSGWDVRYSVDGGTESGNITQGTYSTVLQSRNYAPNNVLPVVNGLSLGVHTVKIRQGAAGSFGLTGIQILNESSSVRTNAGSVFNKGQKLTLASQDVTSYNSGVTGTRGGRVVTYITSSGVLGRAFQAVNASTATSTSADHTNEEVARVYSPFEFGSGRTDDFGSTGVTAARAFALDDGTTNLLSSAAIFYTVNGSGYSITEGNSTFGTFTFVGTGLDIELNDSANGGSDQYQFSIDGGTAINFPYTTGSQAKRVIKIASGLPYGTHTVKLIRNTAATFSVIVKKFIVYQPKKPTIPTGAVEISDYNVLADYVASTPNLSFVATGVIRKAVSQREATFTGTWAVNGIDATGFDCGVSTSTSVAASTMSYSFFGTGFELRNLVIAQAQNWSMQVDGVSNLTSLTTSFAQSGSGVSFTPSTGVYSGTSSASNKLRTSVTGLTLGWHTVKLTMNNTSNLYVDAIDIITPIHSYRAVAEYDQSNTLNIGSQSITDSRKWTPIKDVNLQKKNVAQAFGISASPTTTSTALVPMPDMSVTHFNNSGRIKISYTADVVNNTVNAAVVLGIIVDGIRVGQLKALNFGTLTPNGNTEIPVSDVAYVNVSPGFHKVDLFWQASGGGTLAASSDRRNLLVEEM